ncbi:hypothetical protein [Deinococcus fonticola]|uniref:hypothetical protein n=1 Tax=Deinococcus fonticola TaxID=2528713 RepID=UPI00107508CC|nr:hypothetical protein [Deinococcus fonticola]
MLFSAPSSEGSTESNPSQRSLLSQGLSQGIQQGLAGRSTKVDLGDGPPAPTDPEEWLRALWPGTFTAPLAPFQLDYWNWIFKRDPSKASAGAFIWPRGYSKTTNARRAPVALATLGYRYVLYVQANQDMADSSVQGIGQILASTGVRRHYPKLARAKKGVHGNSMGWRRSRVWTDSGLIIDAAGLDSAIRGLNLDDARPDLIVFDDIDSRKDSLLMTEKKLETIRASIIPAGAPGAAVMVMQNLITPHGVVTRLADVNPEFPRDFLMSAYVSGPHKAIDGFTYDMSGRDPETHRPIYRITGGIPTWPEARPIPVLEDLLNQIGPDEFIAEVQNEIKDERGSLYAGYQFHPVDRDAFDFEDVQVWCDIAVTATDASDNQAIAAAGRATTGQVVTLHSWEGREGTAPLMRRAIQVAVDLEASTLGIETNQGGDLWRDSFRRTWAEMVNDGTLSPDTPIPRYAEVKATTATGGKRERWQYAKGMRERGELLDAIGTHESLFRALKRLPENKPYDLADADAWAAQMLHRPKTQRSVVVVKKPRSYV